MDDKTLQKHYERIMRELENEKLLTFDELVNITKIRPEVLKRTIPVLARGLCYYQQQKEELLLEDEDIDEHWTVQDMQDIVAFEEKRDQAMQKYHKEKNPNFEKNDGIVSFEDLVKLTGTHPFYLERCLCHLAILAETEN
ncbi:uncharacterized protein LOC110180545 isoform X2 [Drosophila serrata]|uniref:uncharacterized protein LOC110180545 isoform X2 n=1 Tax=Drosophila serrata TaxID=7274 RepID=UPI000A1D2D6A|nr:uncharacterized protein LOC110180545 isoform X2 [Drosophila serrata]